MSRVILPYNGRSPIIADDVFIAPNTSIIGDVTIGAGSSVWFGTTIRGDVMSIQIGERTSIQDGSVVHATEGWAPTLVGDDCVVGHKVILHGCTVGDRVLVGMGACILDAAKIGNDVIIGAGSLVTTKKEIPDGVLVMGSPAKIIRPLTDADRASILGGAAHYVKKSIDYREMLAANE